MDKEIIKLPYYVEKVDNLSNFDKMYIYWHEYYVPMLIIYVNLSFSLKNNIPMINTHKASKIMSFEDFTCKKKNIVIFDNGIDWAEKKFAQKYTVVTYGIYNYGYISKYI